MTWIFCERIKQMTQHTNLRAALLFAFSSGDKSYEVWKILPPFLKFIYLFLLCWVFVSVQGLSPVAASGGDSSSRCTGLPLSRPPPLRSTGSRRTGSAVVAHGPSCSAARGILPDQGSNPCPPHRQADSQPLRHQGSPYPHFLDGRLCVIGLVCRFENS